MTSQQTDMYRAAWSEAELVLERLSGAGLVVLSLSLRDPGDGTGKVGIHVYSDTNGAHVWATVRALYPLAEATASELMRSVHLTLTTGRVGVTVLVDGAPGLVLARAILGESPGPAGIA